MDDIRGRRALFISHATPEDNHFALWLGAKLAAMGFEVWADVLKLRGGADWARDLETALRQRAIKMLLVCTRPGLDRQGVRNEIEIASQLAKQLDDPEFIIPLRLEDYEAPFRVVQAQYIDFKHSWAGGLAELVDLLVNVHNLPRSEVQRLDSWKITQAVGARELVKRSERLTSNWLRLSHFPTTIQYCVPPSGLPLERFQNRFNFRWPAVPFAAGVLTFLKPTAGQPLAVDVSAVTQNVILVQKCLDVGWESLGIDRYSARRIFADLGAQAFNRYTVERGLKATASASGHLSWWGDVKTVPLNQIRFDWQEQNGRRQFVGKSDKRGVHWHYAVNASARMAPVPHIRLSARLVFSDNGLDALNDTARAHRLRRSMAKGWRNPRWRDMLCAYLWWLTGGSDELRLPVAPDEWLGAELPPMSFACPVSVPEEGDKEPDEDDPDIDLDNWDEHESSTAEQESLER